MKFYKALVFLMTIAFTQGVNAYIGPGAGISAIGSAIAFVIIVILLIVGFLWYPLKKILANVSSKKEQEQDKDSDESIKM